MEHFNYSKTFTFEIYFQIRKTFRSMGSYNDKLEMVQRYLLVLIR
jgi:predicted DNA-binding protein YlxM (UPF0122 family)